jgi:hypothetical protein
MLQKLHLEPLSIKHNLASQVNCSDRCGLDRKAQAKPGKSASPITSDVSPPCTSRRVRRAWWRSIA